MSAGGYNIWEKWHDPPTQAAHLKVLSRQVIGMMDSIRDITTGEISVMLQCDHKIVQSIRRDVKKSNHPVIKVIRKYGLPVSASVHLPTEISVRCKECNGKLCEVPCICCRIRDSYIPRGEVPEGEGFVDIGKGTSYPPGSWGKIETMRERLSKGYSAFSSKDVL